jgi:hypothetical protein
MLENKFFQINSDTNNLFDYLTKLIKNTINTRPITNQIIYFNILLYLEINPGNYDKIKFSKKLTQILLDEIKKIRDFISTKTKLKNLTYELSKRAFNQYINPIDKTCTNLNISPFPLIPIIYLDTEESTPIYFKENKFDEDILTTMILNLFCLSDILKYLLGLQKKMIINTKKFLLKLKQNEFEVLKEYSIENIGKDYDCYEVIIKRTISKMLIFCDNEFIYFGKIISGTFNDLSNIKITKKLLLRNIEIKAEMDKDIVENPIIEIIDNSKKENIMLDEDNSIEINCFKNERKFNI